jgi:hypothetical protein
MYIFADVDRMHTPTTAKKREKKTHTLALERRQPFNLQYNSATL